MKTIKWCNLNNGCVKNPVEPTEDFCSTNWLRKGNVCEHYNPKMNFFEAWEKAEEGDVLIWKESAGLYWTKITKDQKQIFWADGQSVSKATLFYKEWTIIPKKKTVTVDIPENAKNIKLVRSDDHILDTYTKYKKITYEIDQ